MLFTKYFTNDSHLSREENFEKSQGKVDSKSPIFFKKNEKFEHVRI